MVKGVIFDMDGLMFDTERLWEPLWSPCCAQYGLPAPSDAFIAGARGMSGQNMLNHIAAYYPGVDPKALYNTLYNTGMEAFADGVPVKPGLMALLAWLGEEKIPRVVASSSPRAMIDHNLLTTGTARYFAQVVAGPEIAHSKPAPDIFLEAARRLAVPAEHCLVLEDSFNGVRAGRAAGAVTVMVPDLLPPTPEIAALCDACCDDLFGVLALLKAHKL